RGGGERLPTAVGEGGGHGRGGQDLVCLRERYERNGRPMTRSRSDPRPLARFVGQTGAAARVDAGAVQDLPGVAVRRRLVVNRDIDDRDQAVIRAVAHAGAATGPDVGGIEAGWGRSGAAGAFASSELGHDEVGAGREVGRRPPGIGAGVDVYGDGIDPNGAARVVDDPDGTGVVLTDRGRRAAFERDLG